MRLGVEQNSLFASHVSFWIRAIANIFPAQFLIPAPANGQEIFWPSSTQR